MTVFAFMCAQTGDEMIILVIFIQAVVFHWFFFQPRWQKCGTELDGETHSVHVFFPLSSPPHGADFTEIKQNVSQPTGRTDVRKTQ